MYLAKGSTDSGHHDHLGNPGNPPLFNGIWEKLWYDMLQFLTYTCLNLFFRNQSFVRDMIFVTALLQGWDFFQFWHQYPTISITNSVRSMITTRFLHILDHMRFSLQFGSKFGPWREIPSRMVELYPSWLAPAPFLLQKPGRLSCWKRRAAFSFCCSLLGQQSPVRNETCWGLTGLSPELCCSLAPWNDNERWWHSKWWERERATCISSCPWTIDINS